MIKKVLGWALVGMGVIGALLGLLVVFGGETGDGGTMIGVGAVLAATGWGLRSPAGVSGSSDGSNHDHDWDRGSSSDDSGSDGGDSGDSGGD